MKFTANFEEDYLLCGNIELPWNLVDQDLELYKDEQTMNWSIINNNIYQDNASQHQNEYLKYGYTEHNTRSWKTTNFEPKITLLWEHLIYQVLPLDHAVASVHRQDPGQILPWHMDRFYMLRRLYPDDKRPIWRFLIFLEDWKQGHFLQVKDSVLHHWRRGDVVVWQPGTEHLAANVGLEKKWTCNVTGFLTI